MNNQLLMKLDQEWNETLEQYKLATNDKMKKVLKMALGRIGDAIDDALVEKIDETRSLLRPHVNYKLLRKGQKEHQYNKGKKNAQ